MKWIIHNFIFEMAETVSVIWSRIFRLIFSVLHFVYSGLEYFDTTWALFKRKIFKMFSRRDSELYVSHFVTSLVKRPTHFAVITGDEKINLEDFSNLVVWSIAAGISFISFYDYTGYMKDNEKLYSSYLFDIKKLDSNCVVFNEGKNSLKNGSYKNGFSKKIHVNILTPNDGKPLFSKLVENLCERALSDKLKSEDIDESYLDDEIHEMLGIKDPELAVISGNVCCTFGFLPWHIRVTEFLQVPSLKNITVTEFTSMLWRYSCCHQRFGA